MDDDLKKTLEKVFSVKDVVLVNKMLEIVNRELSDFSKGKRVAKLDELLMENLKND